MLIVAALTWVMVVAQDPGISPKDPPPAIHEVEWPPSAGQSAWSIGFGVDVWSGFGSVFNEVIGPSVRLGYRSTHRWSVSVSAFWSDFDFVDPADEVLGRSGTPTADASIDLFMVSATARWHFLASDSLIDAYAGAGLGLALPDRGEAVNQPQVDIEVDGRPGPEVHLALGGSIGVFESLRFVLELRVMHSFTEYEVFDRPTGETEVVESWSAYGLSAGLEWRF